MPAGADPGRLRDAVACEGDARGTLEEIRAVAEWFGGVRGRKKSILLISEGFDYDIYDVFNKRDASMIGISMAPTTASASFAFSQSTISM